MNPIRKAQKVVDPCRGAVMIICALLPLGKNAVSQTLAQVVRRVSDESPLITQAQARANAADAAIGLARAAARPQLSANGNLFRGTRGANAQGGFDQTIDTDVSLVFPVYSGGRAANGLRAARARSESAGYTLDQSRANAVGDAVVVYLDVLRDRAAVLLVERNIDLLQHVLEGTSRQFEAGDSTRTDVAQARARLSSSRARAEAARATAFASEARFAQIVGIAPGALAPPPPVTLPTSLIDSDSLVSVALSRSPSVAAAEAGLRAASADVSIARSAGRPQISATLSGQAHDYRASFAGYADQRGVGGRATGSASVPIYSGGRVKADIQRARALESEASGVGELARREAVATTRRAMIDYRAQLATVVLDEERVAESRESLVGVQADQRGGDRTVLDVLNAHAELLEAEMSLLDSRHDTYASAVAVLRSVDRLDCLGQPGLETCASAFRNR